MSTTSRILSSRYRVDELIGTGGMASVYRGYDLTLGRDVAVKILRRDLAKDRVFRARFSMEAKSASLMTHPSIVRVFDAGEDIESDVHGDHPVPYIVMELVDGVLLKDKMADGVLPIEEATGYVHGILEALSYSHRAGVVHRDIKPGNIMITREGNVKVMDFGIARAATDTSATVAETAQIVGTAAYFSPEQAKGETVDARADIYSTGIVLFELLTGRQPFRGDTPVAVAYQQVSEAPPFPTDVNPEIPHAFNGIVLRALAKDPDQRFATAEQFDAALSEAERGSGLSKRQLTRLNDELYGEGQRRAEETARTIRQLSSDTTMTRTQSGPPVAWIWAGVVIIAILLGSVLFWVINFKTTPPPPAITRVVPDLKNSTFEEAEAQLTKLELRVQRLEEHSANVDIDKVTRTSPIAGTKMSPNQTVEVYISLGPEQVKVPPLEGLTLEQATDAIDKAKLQTGTITHVNKAKTAKDLVLEASAKAGQTIDAGTTIDLTVASGRVTLDSVKDMTVDRARDEIEELGLVAELAPQPETICSDPVDPANDQRLVLSQSVTGDVDIDSTVTLGVCTPAGESSDDGGGTGE